MKFVLVCAALSAATAAASAPMPDTCSGDFFKLKEDPGYMVGSCAMDPAIAKVVMGTCPVGQRCTVVGLTDHCARVRGACLELTRIQSVHRAKD